ncbi:MAG: hypothetical protein KC561_10325 [Myxococcales bacterium]|nr:hypothetical protein [Myxococcales bacterium]
MKLPKLTANEWRDPARLREVIEAAIAISNEGLAANSDAAEKAYKALGPMLEKNLSLEFLFRVPEDLRTAWDESFGRFHERVVGFAPGEKPTTEQFNTLFPPDRLDEITRLHDAMADLLEAADGATPKQLANYLRSGAKRLGLSLAPREAMRLAAADMGYPIPPL